jgi:uncharacterized protein
LRALALFGVLMANLMGVFRVSIFKQLYEVSSDTVSTLPASLLDHWAQSFVEFGLEFKAISLFSLLFGFGMAMQFQALRRHFSTQATLTLLLRRLLILGVFGVLHLVFIWNGDILSEYALVGLLVLPSLLLSNATVFGLAMLVLALFIFPNLQPWALDWFELDTLRDAVQQANQIYANGSHAEVWHHNVAELPLVLRLHLFILPRTVGLFLLGIWLYRIDIVQKAARWPKRFFSAALLGIVFFIIATISDQEGILLTDIVAAQALLNGAPIILALAYAALVITFCQTRRNALAYAFAAMGKMALTNYLTQSIVLGWIFFGYGFGQFNKMPAATGFLLGVAIYVIQILLSVIYLRYYQFGPAEWLWRSLMYGRWQAMRRTIV